jgi:hypothetical protein
MIDIYTKRNVEASWVNKLDETDPIKIYIQKIKMILFTKKGEVIGDPNFGINLESMLFHKFLNNEQIKNDLEQQISMYCQEFDKYQTSIDVKFYKLTNKDECEISISINDIQAITIRTF